MIDRLLRFSRFGAIGVACAIVYFVVLHACVVIAGFPVFWSSALAFASGIPLSYLGNRRLTYRSANKLDAEFVRFCVAQAGNLVITSAVVAVATDFFKVPLWGSAFLSYVTAPIVTFILFELWVYRQRAYDISPAQDRK